MNSIATVRIANSNTQVSFFTLQTGKNSLSIDDLLLASLWGGDITNTLQRTRCPCPTENSMTSTEEPHLLIYHSNNFPFRNMSQMAENQNAPVYTIILTALL